jgi:hypothetical protein
MLFNIGKKKKSTSKEPAPTFELSVPYSDHFKGYKRIKLAVYRDPEADKGIDWFRAADKVDQITFKEYIFPDTNPLLRVYGDGLKIGTIWSNSRPEEYKLIKAGHAKKASVGFVALEDQVFDGYLYVKFE